MEVVREAALAVLLPASTRRRKSAQIFSTAARIASWSSVSEKSMIGIPVVAALFGHTIDIANNILLRSAALMSTEAAIIDVQDPPVPALRLAPILVPKVERRARSQLRGISWTAHRARHVIACGTRPRRPDRTVPRLGARSAAHPQRKGSMTHTARAPGGRSRAAPATTRSPSTSAFSSTAAAFRCCRCCRRARRSGRPRRTCRAKPHRRRARGTDRPSPNGRGRLCRTPLYLAENVNWHCAVAAASHNELLSALLVAISSMIYKASAIENFATEEVRKVVIRAHRRILDAIVERTRMPPAGAWRAISRR